MTEMLIVHYMDGSIQIYLVFRYTVFNLSYALCVKPFPSEIIVWFMRVYGKIIHEL